MIIECYPLKNGFDLITIPGKKSVTVYKASNEYVDAYSDERWIDIGMPQPSLKKALKIARKFNIAPEDILSVC